MARSRLNSPKRAVFTWATKPAANSFPVGTPIWISDVGVNGGSSWVTNGVGWIPVNGKLLIAANEPALNHTGDIVDQTGASGTDRVLYTLPADILGPHGSLEIHHVWSYTNSANTKTLRVRFGGTSGTSAQLPQPTTTATAQLSCFIRNQNSKTSQIYFAPSSSNTFVTSSSSLATSTIDTSVAQDILIGGQLTNTGEFVKLEAYRIYVEPAW